ncbi:NRF domain-containing protein [Trichonephila inaurata madagascariensis]|uniref:NRF domain-containing protein n=1 Tax=Trichonephila inaurata madagascariensis TaxID=2747483 RepID=A0A8X7CEU0_9ARAC|nr:NRF domain-containing protein [Trichonephila inaurata madagascariensis]
MVDGILSGSMTFLGIYDQCLNTTVPHPKMKEKALFRGQYCLTEIRSPLPPKTRRYKLYDEVEELRNFSGTEVVKFLSTKAHFHYIIPFRAGLCVPSGCSKDDLSQLLSIGTLFLIEDIATEPVAQMIINGSEAVDTFFFMSIAPMYYFILLFATLIPLMGSGPLFNETMEEFVYPCSQYWWRNVLFINNYFHLKDMCMVHTWYVSCDFQLYLASLIVILPLLKSEKIGVAINIILIGVSVIYTGILTYVGQIIPTVIMTMPDPIDRNLGYLYTYGNTLSRGGPYFIGILTGYLLFKYPEAKIPKIFQVFGWCLAILSSGLIVFITGAWYRIRPPTPLEVLMYATFYKVAFTSGIAWMTFCCITGRGGILNKFLSWKVWIPLGKLVFLIYLIQPIFQTLFIANFRSTQEYTHLFFIVQFFGFLCISSLLAMICNMLVESPFLSLEKIFFKTDEEKRDTVEDANVTFDALNGLKMNMKTDTARLENGSNNPAFDSVDGEVRDSLKEDETLTGNEIERCITRIMPTKPTYAEKENLRMRRRGWPSAW